MTWNFHTRRKYEEPQGCLRDTTTPGVVDFRGLESGLHLKNVPGQQ